MFGSVRQNSSIQPASLSRQAPIGKDNLGPVKILRKTIVFVAPQDRVPDCLIAAVEREFPSYAVRLIDNVGEAEMESVQPVALYLIDGALISAFRAHRARPGNQLANVAAAVLFDDVSDARACYAELCRSDFLSGVLPMNLRLDTWLTALALILRGGEFIPTSLIRGRSPGHGQINGHVHPATAGGDAEADEAPPAAFARVSLAAEKEMRAEPSRSVPSCSELDELTERERQVLEQVARGTSNKVIAARFGLSEHTIKIHLHNIIRKLKVTNRTEAAAIFIQARIHD